MTFYEKIHLINLDKYVLKELLFLLSGFKIKVKKKDGFYFFCGMKNAKEKKVKEKQI